MLNFSERKKLADEYRKWLKEEDKKLYDLARVHIEDGPEAVIGFLSSKGYLQEVTK